MEDNSEMVQPGVRVTLHVPENPRLHLAEGEVKRRTEYGALVRTSAAATGEFRAHWSEMVVEGLNGIAGPSGHVGGSFQKIDVYLAKQAGATGDFCKYCNGVNVVRNGNCLLCRDCGETSGCS